MPDIRFENSLFANKKSFELQTRYLTGVKQIISDYQYHRDTLLLLFPLFPIIYYYHCSLFIGKIDFRIKIQDFILKILKMI